MQIKDILEDYSNGIQDSITQSAIEIAEEGKNKLLSTSPRNRGKYWKGWKVDKKQGKGFIHTTIYNSTNWQLTHLLEKPHVIKNQFGTWGTSKPIVHIAPVEKECVSNFEKEVEQIIKNGG